MVGTRPPQLGIRLRDHTAVCDDPLSVERPEAIADGRWTGTGFIDELLWVRFEARYGLFDNGPDVAVGRYPLAESCVEKDLLLSRRRGHKSVPPIRERIRVGRYN